MKFSHIVVSPHASYLFLITHPILNDNDVRLSLGYIFIIFGEYYAKAPGMRQKKKKQASIVVVVELPAPDKLRQSRSRRDKSIFSFCVAFNIFIALS